MNLSLLDRESGEMKLSLLSRRGNGIEIQTQSVVYTRLLQSLKACKLCSFLVTK